MSPTAFFRRLNATLLLPLHGHHCKHGTLSIRLILLQALNIQVMHLAPSAGLWGGHRHHLHGTGQGREAREAHGHGSQVPARLRTCALCPHTHLPIGVVVPPQLSFPL